MITYFDYFTFKSFPKLYLYYDTSNKHLTRIFYFDIIDLAFNIVQLN